MTRAYWEFLVHGEKFQAPIPRTKEVQRPRTSKGITNLLLLNLVRLDATCPSKEISLYVGSKNSTAQRTVSRQDTKSYVYLAG
ncbi:hypothetical protein TKK_0016621 [Trichogramma kaykai]